MSKQQQYGVAACVGVIVLLAATLFLRAQRATTAPESPGGGTIYYTGPMKSKSNSGVYTDEAGHIFAPPAPPIKPADSKATNAGAAFPNAPPPASGKP